MTEIKAIETVKCGGKFRRPGDTFECDDALASDLIDRGVAEATASKPAPKAEKEEKPEKAAPTKKKSARKKG